jgi:hypothetical protein
MEMAAVPETMTEPLASVNVVNENGPSSAEAVPTTTTVPLREIVVTGSAVCPLPSAEPVALRPQLADPAPEAAVPAVTDHWPVGWAPPLPPAVTLTPQPADADPETAVPVDHEPETTVPPADTAVPPPDTEPLPPDHDPEIVVPLDHAEPLLPDHDPDMAEAVAAAVSLPPDHEPDTAVPVAVAELLPTIAPLAPHVAVAAPVPNEFDQEKLPAVPVINTLPLLP